MTSVFGELSSFSSLDLECYHLSKVQGYGPSAFSMECSPWQQLEISPSSTASHHLCCCGLQWMRGWLLRELLTFKVAFCVVVDKFASFYGRTNKGVMLKQDNTMAADTSGLLTIVKTGITIVSYFGNVTASLFALTIVRKFTPRWSETIQTNYS